MLGIQFMNTVKYTLFPKTAVKQICNRYVFSRNSIKGNQLNASTFDFEQLFLC